MEEFSTKIEELIIHCKRMDKIVKRVIRKNKKSTLVIGGGILLIVIVIGAVSIMRGTQIRLTSQETSGVDIVDLDEENSAREREDIDITTLELEENAYTEINQFIAQYHMALQNGDVDTLRTFEDISNDTEEISVSKRSNYIEAYQNITCYTKLGPLVDSYIVYAYSEVKFNEIETSAPGLTPLYIYKDATGSLQIAKDQLDDATTEYLREVSSQDDVVDLFNTVQVKYNEAIASDQELNDFLVELPTRLKTEIGEELAAIEIAKNEAAQAEEQTTEESVEEANTTTQVTFEVKANTTVNVRGSDSLEADKVGRALEGETFTCSGQFANGWSLIVFEGSNAYIKSEFLDVISTIEETVESEEETEEETSQAVVEEDTSTSAGDRNDGQVHIVETINIRKSANTTSDKLGVAYPGESYEIIMKQADGWTKINYKGQTGYVKSEFVEF